MLLFLFFDVVVTVNVALLPVVFVVAAGWLAMKGVFMAYAWTGIGTGRPWKIKCVCLCVKAGSCVCLSACQILYN